MKIPQAQDLFGKKRGPSLPGGSYDVPHPWGLKPVVGILELSTVR